MFEIRELTGQEYRNVYAGKADTGDEPKPSRVATVARRCAVGPDDAIARRRGELSPVAGSARAGDEVDQHAGELGPAVLLEEVAAAFDGDVRLALGAGDLALATRRTPLAE